MIFSTTSKTLRLIKNEIHGTEVKGRSTTDSLRKKNEHMCCDSLRKKNEHMCCEWDSNPGDLTDWAKPSSQNSKVNCLLERLLVVYVLQCQFQNSFTENSSLVDRLWRCII
jgi:hypothetical protein